MMKFAEEIRPIPAGIAASEDRRTARRSRAPYGERASTLPPGATVCVVEGFVAAMESTMKRNRAARRQRLREEPRRDLAAQVGKVRRGRTVATSRNPTTDSIGASRPQDGAPLSLRLDRFKVRESDQMSWRYVL